MAVTAPDAKPDEPLSNAEIQRRIGARVAEEFLSPGGGTARLNIGPLEVNYFSFVFRLDEGTGSDRREFFVKIPKSDLRGRQPVILPLSPEDAALGREEEKSLRFLAERWDGREERVQWIELVGFLQEYNALLTKRVAADHAFAAFRRMDLRRRLGSRCDGEHLRHAMKRLGSALGRFHARHGKPTQALASTMRPKLEFYCRGISERTHSRWPGRVEEHVGAMGDRTFNTLQTATLKGIDIRNVLINDDSLFLLDPGKIKTTCREADLARFAMTYRLLHWGSRSFLLVGEPDRHAEKAFFRGYYARCPETDPKLLELYFLKEQLKHWHTALNSLSLKPWPSLFKSIVTRIYVNPFFERQIAGQMRQ